MPRYLLILFESFKFMLQGCLRKRLLMSFNLSHCLLDALMVKMAQWEAICGDLTVITYLVSGVLPAGFQCTCPSLRRQA